MSPPPPLTCSGSCRLSKLNRKSRAHGPSMGMASFCAMNCVRYSRSMTLASTHCIGRTSLPAPDCLKVDMWVGFQVLFALQVRLKLQVARKLAGMQASARSAAAAPAPPKNGKRNGAPTPAAAKKRSAADAAAAAATTGAASSSGQSRQPAVVTLSSGLLAVVSWPAAEAGGEAAEEEWRVRLTILEQEYGTVCGMQEISSVADLDLDNGRLWSPSAAASSAALQVAIQTC